MYVQADITDRKAMLDPSEKVQRALTECKVEALLHVAALVGPFFPKPAYMRVNYDGTLNVIDACRAAGLGSSCAPMTGFRPFVAGRHF